MNDQVTLGDLIIMLERTTIKGIITLGLCAPHSYRGSYEQLAFYPTCDVAVKQMLAEASACVGKDFGGYKGGRFRMHEGTRLWVASYGSTGWPLTEALVELMLERLP